jgi:peptidoglycan hydrolase-like protein with peptidoglycan-binding domain
MNTDKRRFKVAVLSALICVNLRPNFLAAEGAPATKKAAALAKSRASANTKAPTAQTARKASNSVPPGPPVRRGPQLAPTKERYKQIQEALAAKGYLKPSEATGQWTATSIDALKRFQANQNLEATGKINSLSLIALGLGPKHETASRPKSTP